MTTKLRSELTKLEYLQNALEILNAAVHSPSSLPPQTVPMEVDRLTEELAAILKALQVIADELGE